MEEALEWVEGFFLRKPKGLRDFLAAEEWVSLEEPLSVLEEVVAEGGVWGRNECWERDATRPCLSMLPKLESANELWFVVAVVVLVRVRERELVAGLAEAEAEAEALVVGLVDRDEEGVAFSF